MPNSQLFDAAEGLLDVSLPYDVLAKELDTQPRWIAGSNGLVDLGGRFRKRPAARVITDMPATPAGTTIERLWIYKTIENPEKVYLIGSFKITASSKYTIYWVRLDATTPAWTQITDVRNVRISDYPHEVVMANGQCYIKGFAIAAAEKYGTVRFDGTNTTGYLWGAPGPTVSAVATSHGGWDASDNATTITYGWLYSYSYELASGHITSRSPFTVPTGIGVRSTSDTGPFVTLVPEVTYTGQADTTNYPFINFWRTTDGGGELVFLDRIANPGSGSQTFVDNKRIPTPVTNGDPKTDFQLDTQNFAPSLLSNAPPPSVAYPLVVGTDTIQRTTQMAEYAGRIWYGIGNILVFSGFEEIVNGIPYESFPTGLRGNYIRLRSAIRNVVATTEALYIICADEVLWLRGTDRSSFQIKPLFRDLGGAENQPTAAAALRDVVGFLTTDNQIALIRGSEIEIITGPLGNTLTSISDESVTILGHFFDGNAWIVVGVADLDTPANSRIYVYDLNRNQWNVPWTVPFTAMVSGKIREDGDTRELVVAVQDGSGVEVLAFQLSSATDQFPAGDAGFAWSGESNTFFIPAGNHVNQLRRQGMTGTLGFIKVEHTGSATPTVGYRLNEISGSFTNLTLTNPPYRTAPSTYEEKWGAVSLAATRAAVKISKSADTTTQFLQSVAFIWQTTSPPSV